MLLNKGLFVLCLIFVIYQVEAYPRKHHEKRTSSAKTLKEEEKEIEYLLREISKFKQFDKKDVKVASNDVDSEETEEVVSEEAEEVEDNDGNSQNRKRGYQAPLAGEGHGGAMLSQARLPPDSPLSNLVESFHAVVNGEVVHANNINPRMNSKNIGDNLDHHKMTRDQMVEAGLISETAAGNGRKRNFIQSNSALWPMKTIPYEIRTSDFTTAQIAIINQGINEFHTKTCLRWEPKSDAVAQRVGHNSYIEFFSESGCWSYVGRVFSGRQQVSLQAPWCVSVSTAVHEMCHAIGQQHEQSRNDRDNYVDMYWNNIQGGTGNINMAKSNTRDNNPYDAESVLQYSLYAFSTNGQKVMDFKDRKLNFLADTAKGLEFYDIQDVTDAYGCADGCQNPPACQNGGFVNFQCVCVCPDGLTGPTCEQIADSCGSIITLTAGQSVDIKTQNYPSPYPQRTKCTWLLKASNSLFPKITVVDLELPQQNGVCFHWLEVQYNLPGQTGPRLCGSIQGETYISSADSGNVMLLRFDSAFAADRTPLKGFHLQATASGAGCRQNNCAYGTCVDTNAGGYTCQCDTGFTGQYCDQPDAQATLSCTFEDKKCFMADSTSDQFDWTVNSGSTPSSSTGPSAAHGGNNYLYAEMSSPRVSGDKAIFESTLSLPSSQRCLTFWYHMYGGTVGTLNVKAVPSSGNPVNLFSESGDKTNKWHEATVNVPAQTGQKIQFEAIRGSSWNSDIAIDDVVLRPGSCQGPTTQPPTTRPPTTQPPTTRPPTTQPPTTQPPTTQPPTTQPPTTQPPTTQPPTTRPPTTQPPTTQPPTTQPPTTQPSTSPTVVTTNPTVTPTSGPAVPLTCTFESGSPCWLTDSQNDDFDWSTRAGSTPSSGTGPRSAIEGTRYSYIEASSPRRSGDMAILESVNPLAAGEYCMEFAYHMYGSSMGDLWINETNEFGMMWHMSGDQGNTWHKTAVQFNSWKPMQVQIVAVRGSSFRSDIAVDNVTIGSGNCGCKSNPCFNGGTCMDDVVLGYTCVCAAGFTGYGCESMVVTTNPTVTPTSGPAVPLTCTFESGSPCWLTDSQNDDFDWSTRAGSTPSSGTGPGSASEGTRYSYIEASSPRRSGDMAILESVNPLAAGDYCMEFAYHMYGSSMGDLWINETNEFGMMWHMSGDQGNAWHKTAVQFNSWKPMQVQIVAVRGSSFRSDIAVDNVTIQSGECGCKSNPCFNGGTCLDDVVVGYTCVCAAGFTGYGCETIGDVSSHVCSFENNEPDCFFKEADGIDDFDWSRKTGGTGSSSTGPNSASDGSYYKYIETSAPRKAGDIAILQTEAIDHTLGERCLFFKYHMYGSDIDSLVVNMQDLTLQSLELWRMDGEKGQTWLDAAVVVPPSSIDYQLEIVGKRGNGYRGDIAIDEINLNLKRCLCASNPCNGNSVCIEDATVNIGYRCDCQTGYKGVNCNEVGDVPVECTFETTDCFFKNLDQTAGDVFQWTMFHSGRTPSGNTGPSSAAGGGMYAYIEASSPRKNGDNAIMTTADTTFEARDRCLQFEYHMFGQPGSLNVYAYSRLDSPNLVWTEQGNKGNTWISVQIDISNISDLVIDIEGTRGISYRGDIAVDEIKLIPGACQYNASSGLTLHTPNSYNYHSLSDIGINATNRTSLVFTVRACNDAHIGLFTAYPSMTQNRFYEIVIGGWANSKSVIRKHKQGYAWAQKHQRNLLSCKNAQPFWVSWNNGHIKVGTGQQVNSNTFMEWTDPNPYLVKFVAVSSGFGSDADWTFL